MKTENRITRRSTLKGLLAAGAAGTCGAAAASGAGGAAFSSGAGGARRTGSPSATMIDGKVMRTALVDTHEHLIEERGRLNGTDHPRVKSDDWSLLLSHYLNSDMLTAGMPQKDHDAFFDPGIDPVDKWQRLKPVWPFVKNTGYGQAIRHSIRALYGVEDLSDESVVKVARGYEKVRRPGFYRDILVRRANILSCQVNSLEGTPFMETSQPLLLMQDISIVGMFAGPAIGLYSEPAGIQVTSLDDWYDVLEWWFARYGPYAVAVKTQNAYSRDIDYERVSRAEAEPAFTKVLKDRSLNGAERKKLEDHLFWIAVELATEHDLPVKLHTGYYAGQNRMPLTRVGRNPGSACELCRAAPETRFVFMHIGYPYYEEMIALAKQYSNAHIDMCWSWIINPVAAKDFLKKYLVTAPANKIFPFGGDYVPVEPVLGHAMMVRQGIAQALNELVRERWLSEEDALELVEPIMHRNAERLFSLAEKERRLKQIDWTRI